MAKTIIAAGTDRHAAQIFTNTICSLKDSPSFIENYGRGHIMAEANGPRRSLNISRLDATDLRTFKKDGTIWDLSRRADRDEAAILDYWKPSVYIFLSMATYQLQTIDTIRH